MSIFCEMSDCVSSTWFQGNEGISHCFICDHKFISLVRLCTSSKDSNTIAAGYIQHVLPLNISHCLNTVYRQTAQLSVSLTVIYHTVSDKRNETTAKPSSVISRHLLIHSVTFMQETIHTE